MGVATNGIYGYGLYFVPDEHNNPKLVWTELARIIDVEVDEEELEKTLEDQVIPYWGDLAKKGIYFTSACGKDEVHWLITGHKPWEADRGESLIVKTTDMIEIVKATGPRMMELARVLGFDEEDVQWRITSYWG
jgi:hypothetical protein